VSGRVSVLIADGCPPLRDSVAGRRLPTPIFHMPGIGGTEATRRIRAAHKDLMKPDLLTRFSLAAD
jgi:hypothetical protein